jgi:stage III sporulation protein SpoIIIAA
VKSKSNLEGHPNYITSKKKGCIPLLEKSTQSDLQEILKNQTFLTKNRSFIDETLHRVSCARGLKEGDFTAVTIRIGRPIIGISEIFNDLLEQSNSILFIGPPGIGKTSMIRDLARNISGKQQKTIVIDSSCEISGYSSHPASGTLMSCLFRMV